METELKMRFIKPDEVHLFLGSDWIKQFILPDSCVQLDMKSRYFDTADQILTRMGSSFRIRDEGSDRVAAVKSGMQSANGLHQRQEWQLLLKPDATLYDAAEPDLGYFEKYAISDGDPDEHLHKLVLAVGNRELTEICQARFNRTACDIGYGESLIEMAVDLGKLTAGQQQDDICEIELELKSGDVRNIISLGEELMKQFNLEPETRSKYARCLALMERQV